MCFLIFSARVTFFCLVIDQTQLPPLGCRYRWCFSIVYLLGGIEKSSDVQHAMLCPPLSSHARTWGRCAVSLDPRWTGVLRRTWGCHCAWVLVQSLQQSHHHWICSLQKAMVIKRKSFEHIECTPGVLRDLVLYHDSKWLQPELKQSRRARGQPLCPYPGKGSPTVAHKLVSIYWCYELNVNRCLLHHCHLCWMWTDVCCIIDVCCIMFVVWRLRSWLWPRALFWNCLNSFGIA